MFSGLVCGGLLVLLSTVQVLVCVVSIMSFKYEQNGQGERGFNFRGGQDIRGGGCSVYQNLKNVLTVIVYVIPLIIVGSSC